MITTPQKSKKSLLHKLLKIGLLGICLLLLAGVGLGVFGVWYLGSDRVKTIENLAFFGGGSLSVGSISVSDVWSYPEIDLIVCDLYVWEEDRTSLDSAFFIMNEGRLRLRADLLNSDTILLRQLTYNGGRLHLIKDDQNQDAIERMRDRRPEKSGNPRFQVISSPRLNAGIERVDFRLAIPNQGKDYDGFIRRMILSELSLGEDKLAKVDFDVEMNGLTLKADEGAYIKDTRVKGNLDFQYIGNKITAAIPNLVAGVTAIDFEATVFPNGDSINTFRFIAPSVNMEVVRPMLSPGIQAKVKDYNVEGTFPAVVDLSRSHTSNTRPEVRIQLQLRGNDAYVQGRVFKDVFLDGTFINRLPNTYGTYSPELLGSTFEIDTISANGFGFDFTNANGKIVSRKGESAVITANLNAHGPAQSLSKLLKSDQYLFADGTLDIKAELYGPLGEATKLLDLSNAKLIFTNPSIRLVEAGVQLPLKHLIVDKQDNVAQVNLQGVTLSEKHGFQVTGNIQGVSSIVGGANPEPVVSKVKVKSAHLSWSDLASYLGSKTAEAVVDPAEIDTAKAFDPVSLKAVLTSIQSSFQPQLDVLVDTLSYADVMLTEFKTGMHFIGKDTLVLERTTFLLDTAQVGFGGSIYIGGKGQTAYQFSMRAKHVNVEQLLPKINYIGSKLLAELNTLPNDVDIEIDQLGFIHDQDGILPNSSTGFIELSSNKQKAFKARVDFEPDRPEEPMFNSTIVELEGNAVLFNDFFNTENFHFRDGDFNFYMAYAGLVPDLKTLIQNEEMALDFRNGRVFFQDADLIIPINQLTLDVLRDTADVRLYLRSEDLGQELRVDGVANNLSEVVLGKTGRQFSTQASVASERIVWNDLNALIGTFSGERDTTADLNLRKTTRAIMTKFRPDVQLRIGELQLNNRLALLQVESGLRMDDDQTLHVDTTGFIYGDGSMALAGSIDLQKLSLTPFDLYLNTEELNLASLLEGFNHFQIQSLKDTKTLEGKMSLDLNLKGEILGESASIIPETAQGKMSFSFYDLEVDGLQQVDDLAKKFRIEDRLDDVKFAPITNIITLDSSTVYLPLMEIPSSAFRVFLEGDMKLGEQANFWLSVPLSNLLRPDSVTALQPIGYADNRFKVHVEFDKDESEGMLKTKLRFSRRKYYKQRQDLQTWKANKKYWRSERKRMRKQKNGG